MVLGYRHFYSMTLTTVSHAYILNPCIFHAEQFIS